jgi:hypothetical protein
MCFAPSSWQILKKCGRMVNAVEAKVFSDQRMNCELVDPTTFIFVQTETWYGEVLSILIRLTTLRGIGYCVGFALGIICVNSKFRHTYGPSAHGYASKRNWVSSQFHLFVTLWGGEMKHLYTHSHNIPLLPFVLDPVACFPSECIWNYGCYIEVVGLPRWVISPVARPLPIQGNANTEETRTYIRVSSGIRIHHPSVREEDIPWLRPGGNCDWHSDNMIWLYN